jgi:hypothetical protein
MEMEQPTPDGINQPVSYAYAKTQQAAHWQAVTQQTAESIIK